MHGFVRFALGLYVAIWNGSQPDSPVSYRYLQAGQCHLCWLDWLSERLKCKYALNPKHHFYKWIITALISCAQWANGLPNVQTAPQCYTLRAAGQQLRGSAKTVAVITVPDG